MRCWDKAISMGMGVVERIFKNREQIHIRPEDGGFCIFVTHNTHRFKEGDIVEIIVFKESNIGEEKATG